MNKIKPSLLLIDGSAYVFRAYYAIPRLTTRGGLPVNAAYGFTLMMLKVMRENPESLFVVAMDRDSRAFRQSIDPNYKANRAPAPDDLKAQFPVVCQILQALNVPVVDHAGYEADDVIATLTRQAVADGFQVTVVSGDKDLMQLVGKGVDLFDPMKERRFGVAEVEEKFGVPPHRVADYLALIGDSSDNVPGVPKVGPKSAAQIIQAFGGVEEIYDHIDEVAALKLRGAKGIAEQLRLHQEQVRRALRLVQLQADLPLKFDESAFARLPLDRDRVRALFQSLEFTKLIADLSLEPPPESPQAEALPQVVLNATQLDEMVRALTAGGSMSFQVLFSGHDTRRDDLLGFAFGGADGRRWYVPVGHRYLGAPRQLAQKVVVEAVRALFENEALQKRLFQLKHAHLALKRLGLTLKGPLHDLELCAYLLEIERRDRSVETLARIWLERVLPPDVRHATTFRKNADSPRTIAEAAEWTGAWLSAISTLLDQMLPRLEAEGLGGLYRDLELPLAEVLADMERVGVRLEPAALGHLSASLTASLDALERRAVSLAGEQFNLNSSQQLAHILFDKLGLPVQRRGRRGPSVDQEVLEKLAPSHPLPALVLEYRSQSKLKSTYLDALPALIERDGRIHTTFHQTVTATGRLSSSDPNLQNIPVRTDLGRQVRAAFVAEPPMRLFSADYSQIELRVLAHFSEDASLLDAFAREEDIHRRTASEIFGVAPDLVSDEMRRAAKAINFGIAYGQSAYGLSQRLDLPVAETQAMIDRYFERYSGVRAWIERTIEEARQHGVVRTLWGRVRPVSEINSNNRIARQAAERVAVNTPIQGTAADLMKRAMIDVARGLASARLKSRLILQVHDELLLEVPDEELDEVRSIVVRAMEGAASLAVPLVVGVGVAANWAEAH